MTVLLGDKSRFAVEVGERDHGLCRVDLWAAGQWLTCDDNMAYVPAFRHSVLRTAARLRSGEGSPVPFDGLSAEAAHRRLKLLWDDAETEDDGELCSRFQILDWGPTTDNLIVNLFRDGERECRGCGGKAQLRGGTADAEVRGEEASGSPRARIAMTSTVQGPKPGRPSSRARASAQRSTRGSPG